MSLFSKKKGASAGGAGGANNASPQERKKIPKPTTHQFLQSGQMNRLFLSDGEVATVFEGEKQGRNPLAWDDMPASLKAQFPHWKDSTPAIKCLSPVSPTKKSPSNTSDMVFQFSASSKHQQPQHTIPYRVMDRDTLNSIALKFDTTPSELAHLNRKPPGLSFSIFPGEVLYVPDGEEHPAEEPPPEQGKDALRSLTNSVEREEGRHSPTSRAELMAEWSTGVGEAVSDTQLTIASKYITDDQGCVHGMLLLSSSALLFHPHTVDPIVMERGKEGLEMLTPLENMAYATLTKECCPTARRSADPDGRHQCRHTLDAHLKLPEAQPTGNHDDGSRRDVSPTPGGDSLLGSLAKEQLSGEDPVVTLAIDRRRDDNTVLSSSGAFSSESHASGGSVHAAAETLQPSGAVTNSLEASGRSNSNGEASTEDLLLDECSEEAPEEEGPAREKEGPAREKKTEEEEGALDDEYYGVDSPVFLHVHLASHAMGSHTYQPLDTKVRGIDIPRQQRRARSLSPSIQHVKTKFCFAVPKRRIDDLATFLGGCHPDAQVPADLPSDPASWTRGLFNIVGDASDLEEEDLHFHDHHFDSSSWEIYSLKDLPRYRPTIDRMDVERNLPLPDLSEDSDLLSEYHLRQLANNLVSQAIGHDWCLIYSTFKHGISLRTLYRNMCCFPESPVLLVVRDDQQKMFGAMLSAPLRISDRFYGTGESFLFSFEPRPPREATDETPSDSDEDGAGLPEFKLYPWTGTNSYFIQGFTDSIGFGSGDGHWGLWLDETFLHGSSYQCETFNNDILSTKQDFICTGVEAWGFLTVHY